MRATLFVLLALGALAVGCDNTFPPVDFRESTTGTGNTAEDIRDTAAVDVPPDDVCGIVGHPCCFNSSGCGAGMNCVTPSCWGPGGTCIPYGSAGLASHPCADKDGNPGGTLCENGKECRRGECVECDPNAP